MEIKLKDCSLKIKKQVILQKVNFEIKEGRFYHLSGENGAGKSVFLQSMLGLTTFYEGQHEINYAKADLCYITSIPFYFDNEKVGSVVKFLSMLYKVPIEELITIMADLALDYQAIHKHLMGELSQGMRQKIAIIPMFLKEPQFFVLDEIFTGFDQKTQKKVVDRLCEIAKQQKTVMLVEHNAQIIDTLERSIEMEQFICKNQNILPA